VRTAIEKFGVLPDDTYNFDETGFQTGVVGTARVITGSERVGDSNLVQPGDREWATVIAGVNAAGWALRTMIILKGKYRLLILDGHGNHATAEFDQSRSENNIIALYMPPHSSHLLQPLDVGCFFPPRKRTDDRWKWLCGLALIILIKRSF
jgi:hypothetical protein